MATKRKLRKATCKICGVTFRRKTAADIIKAVGKHYHRTHPDAMSRKIKRGMRKARTGNGLHNPISGLDVSKWLGFIFPPAGIPYQIEQYREMTPTTRKLVKFATKSAISTVAPQGSLLLDAILNAFDKAVGTEVA